MLVSPSPDISMPQPIGYMTNGNACSVKSGEIKELSPFSLHETLLVFRRLLYKLKAVSNCLEESLPTVLDNPFRHLIFEKL
jgi:hypothetical protein